jgi:Holliday junction resolvase RusA-like endonuclease
MPIVITVNVSNAEAIAQPRSSPSTQLRHGKVFRRQYTKDNGIVAWKQRIRLALRQAVAQHRAKLPWDGPVNVNVATFFERPKSALKSWPCHPVPKTTRPDRDNLEKAILDAGTREQIWRDDSRVWNGPSRKFYCAIGQPAGATIVITLQTWEEACEEARACFA